MQDFDKSRTHKRGLLPLILSGLALLGTAGILPFVNRSHVLTESQPQEPDYVLLNKPNGIIFEQNGYAGVGSNLYLDKNTLDDPIPSTRLELTGLLNLNPLELVIARRMGIRDSANIVRDDFGKFFRKVSKTYEGPNYPAQYTSDLVSLIGEGTQENYLPGAQLIVENDSASVRITSYDSNQNKMGSKKIFGDEASKIAYSKFLERRLKEPYAEIQDHKKEGIETHMSYINELPENQLATVSE